MDRRLLAPRPPLVSALPSLTTSALSSCRASHHFLMRFGLLPPLLYRGCHFQLYHLSLSSSVFAVSLGYTPYHPPPSASAGAIYPLWCSQLPWHSRRWGFTSSVVFRCCALPFGGSSLAPTLSPLLSPDSSFVVSGRAFSRFFLVERVNVVVSGCTYRPILPHLSLQCSTTLTSPRSSSSMTPSSSRLPFYIVLLLGGTSMVSICTSTTRAYFVFCFSASAPL